MAGRPVWSGSVPSSLFPSPLSALLFLPKALPGTGCLHTQLFHLECLFLASLHLAGLSLLWVSDDHPTMTSPPHLQTWLPPPASSPRPQCSPAPLDSFLGAHRYRLSPALACELREGSGFSPDIPSAQHRPSTDSVQGLLC